MIETLEAGYSNEVNKTSIPLGTVLLKVNDCSPGPWLSRTQFFTTLKMICNNSARMIFERIILKLSWFCTDNSEKEKIIHLFFKGFFWYGQFLKFYWTCYNVAFVLCLFFFRHETCGMFAPWGGIEPILPAWKVKSESLDSQGSPNTHF